LEVGRWTGSARNHQPWRFAVVRDSLVRERLSQLGQYAQHLTTAPVIIVVLADPTLGRSDVEFDVGRLCQNLVLAASAQGLGSCPVTLHPENNATTAARLVGLDSPWRAGHVVAVGHSAPRPRGRSAIATGRRPIDELIVHFDREQGSKPVP
jgi:nitroreductase